VSQAYYYSSTCQPRKEIEMYGKEAKQNLIAEFAQLLEYKTFHGKLAKDLDTRTERRSHKYDKPH